MVQFPQIGFPVDPRLHVRSEKAKLDPEFRPASFTLERQAGGYKMDFEPARIQIDNDPYFDSVGLKDMDTLSADAAAAARSVAWEAAANACRRGTAIQHGASIGEFTMRRLTRGIERMLTCIQPAKPEVSCVRAQLSVSYVQDELDYDWDTGGSSAVYTPYSIDMWVEYRSRVTLKGE
ncbi:MAG TPA: DUF6470 family protein [Candidatus Acidoferrum sp.]|nr:DUF6470 family protein [Candidatus Acidoferrum sp.]